MNLLRVLFRCIFWLRPTVHKNMIFVIPNDMPIDRWTRVEGSIEELTFINESGTLHKKQTFTANLKIRKGADPQDIYQ